MIKRLLFLASLCIHVLVNGQSYQRMLIQDTTTWQHYGYIMGVKSPQNPINITNNSIAAIDTISISGNLYKKVYELSVPAFLDYTNKSLIGYMREDTLAKKVFFRQTIAGPDLLLYDFSLSQGDSVMIVFPNQNGYTAYYHADSIVTRTEMCGSRKHFYMRRYVNNVNPNYEYFDWIESIGASYHLLYIFESYVWVQPMNFPNNCKIYWAYGLACKHDDNTLRYRHCTSLYPAYWGSSYYNQCTYYFFSGGLQSQQIKMEIAAYPNPAKSSLMMNLNAESELNVNLSIRDLTGRTVAEQKNIFLKAGENKLEMNISALQPGLYSLITEAGNIKASKIISIEP